VRILKRIDARLLNIAEWPTVLEDYVPTEKRELFCKRQDAVRMVLEGGELRDALAILGGNSAEMVRLIKRCVQTLPDGSLAGFRALVPGFRTKAYQRKDLKGENKAGLLSAFFREHPTIEFALKEYALRRTDRLGLPSKISAVDLRDKFLVLCREAGVSSGYPFNTLDKGERSLARWRDRLFDSNPREMTRAQYGQEAGRNVETGHSAGSAGVDPFTVWVIDEYTVDTELTVAVELPSGEIEHRPMKRCKVISVKRRGSRDIIACKLVLKEEPNVSDFLSVLEAAIRPHERMEFTIPGYSYPPGPCFASELPNCAWTLPDVVMLDNSKVHRSDDVRRAIVETIRATVQFGIVRRPKARGDIENWHSVLATAFRGLASTTGTGPWDPRRYNATEAAVALRIQANHVEQLLELQAARANVKPSVSLKGLTPIEAFKNWTDGAIPRQVPLMAQDAFRLAMLHVNVRLHCDQKNGRRPCVQFEYAKYYGDKLDMKRTEAGKQCVLVLSEADASVGTLYDAHGLKIDDVYTTGVWREPHRLSDRRMFVNLVKARQLAAPGLRSPVAMLREYLSQRALTRDKRSALALAGMDQVSPGPQKAAAPAPQERSKVDDGASTAASGTKVRIGNATLTAKIGQMRLPDNWRK